MTPRTPVAWLVFLLAAAPINGQQGATTALADPEVRVSGAPGLARVLFFSDDPALIKLPPEPTPVAEDVAGERSSTVVVTFGPLREISRTGERSEWISDLTVVGLPPATTIKRTGRLWVPGSSFTTTFLYTIANQNAFAWSVDAPPAALVLPGTTALQFGIAATAEAGSNLRITKSTIQEIDGSRALPPDALSVCSAAAAPCQRVQNIRQGVPESAWLRVAPERVPNGAYRGSVSLALDPSAEVKSFDVTVYKTSWQVKSLGFLLIVSGIVLSLVMVGLRNKVRRNEALAPFAVLAQRVKAEGEHLEECLKQGSASPPPMTVTKTALEQILGDLSPGTLDANLLLPRVLPLSTGLEANAAPYLQERANRFALVKTLIRNGICPTLSRRSADPANLPQYNAALQEFDSIAGALPASLDDLKAGVTRILGSLPSPKVLGAGLGGVITMPSPEIVVVRAEVLRSYFWAIWVVITALTGAVVLVVPNNGFGTSMDLLKCTLWGFGLNVAGSALQQMTASSAGTIVGVTLPR